jgi:hypothetical protein
LKTNRILSVRDYQSAGAGGGQKAGPIPERGRQAFLAVLIGAVALSVAMLLILLAAWRATPSVNTGSNPTGKTSMPADAPNLDIDYYDARTKTGALG